MAKVAGKWISKDSDHLTQDGDNLKINFTDDEAADSNKVWSSDKVNTISGALSTEIDNDVATFSGTIDHDTIINTHNLTSDIDHDALNNYAIGQHRIINDSGDTGTELWSADKLSTHFDASNPHETSVGNLDNVTETSVTDDEVLAYDDGTSEWINQTAAEAGLATPADIATFSGTIDHDTLVNYVVGQHRVINDSGTSATDLWSAEKIVTLSGIMTDHSQLSNLDYASAGHTGFSPDTHDHDNDYYTEAEVDTISGSLSDEIDSDIATFSGTIDHNTIVNTHNLSTDISHNGLSDLQGGDTGEFYHLNVHEEGLISAASNTYMTVGGTDCNVVIDTSADYVRMGDTNNLDHYLEVQMDDQAIKGVSGGDIIWDANDDIWLKIGSTTMFRVDQSGVQLKTGGVIVNEILDSTSTISGASTDLQLATAKLIYGFVDTVSGSLGDKISAVGGVDEVEYLTLASGDITNKYVTLTHTPYAVTETMLHIVKGCVQVYDTDYTVTGTQLIWSGLDLDGVVEIDDQFVVSYTYTT